MTKTELFNTEVITKLEKSKLLVNTNWMSGGENQFLQLIADPQMVESIKCTIINVNLEKAIKVLNISPLNHSLKEKAFLTLRDSAYNPIAMKEVFKHYKGMISETPTLVLTDYIQENSNNSNNKGKWIKYEPRKHGYAPLYFVEWESDKICANTNKQKEENWCSTLKRDVIKFCCSINPDDITRNDLGVRRGHGHEELPLIEYKPPVSGNTYICKHWKQNEISETLINKINYLENAFIPETYITRKTNEDTLQPELKLSKTSTNKKLHPYIVALNRNSVASANLNNNITIT